jgi:AcrR family transcriptional regulator
MNITAKRQSSGRPDKGDDNNRQRLILEAAVELYAQKGFETVTFKGIAAQAGVATSLIRHYFGTKDDFRETCNSYVISEIKQSFALLKPDLSQAAAPSDLDAIGNGLVSHLRARIHLLRYLARLFLIGDQKANALFKEYYQSIKEVTDRYDAAGLLHDQVNPVWVTFNFIFSQLGSVFLMDQIADTLGVDPYQLDVSQARTKSLIHIAKQGIFKD